jgi:hypothetical protein
MPVLPVTSLHSVRSYCTHVHLRNFFPPCVERLAHRCIPIRACLHTRVESISGWEAVEPPTISETSSPIASTNRDEVGRDGTGWGRTRRDALGRHGIARDGMGRDGNGWDRTGRERMGRGVKDRGGRGLNHSNAWPRTASIEYIWNSL